MIQRSLHGYLLKWLRKKLLRSEPWRIRVHHGSGGAAKRAGKLVLDATFSDIHGDPRRDLFQRVQILRSLALCSYGDHRCQIGRSLVCGFGSLFLPIFAERQAFGPIPAQVPQGAAVPFPGQPDSVVFRLKLLICKIVVCSKSLAEHHTNHTPHFPDIVMLGQHPHICTIAKLYSGSHQKCLLLLTTGCGPVVGDNDHGLHSSGLRADKVFQPES